MTGPTSAVLVIIPTYNERENIAEIIGRVRAAQPAVDILVVDDNSPDGTGDIVDGIVAADPSVHVLHERGKEGLGVAYRTGFRWALDRGYTAMVEMDADGSHQPEQLHRLLEGLDHAEVVLGSRWVPGGEIVNWPLRRKLLSKGGSVYARTMLGISVRDATGGYRVYRSDVLRQLIDQDVASSGYCFQIDMVYRAVRSGWTVAEVPITFVERVRGDSKMSGAIVREAMLSVLKWGVQRVTRRDRAALRQAPVSTS